MSLACVIGRSPLRASPSGVPGQRLRPESWAKVLGQSTRPESLGSVPCQHPWASILGWRPRRMSPAGVIGRRPRQCPLPMYSSGVPGQCPRVPVSPARVLGEGHRAVPAPAPPPASPAGDPGELLWPASPDGVRSLAQIPGLHPLAKVLGQLPHPDSPAGFPNECHRPSSRISIPTQHRSEGDRPASPTGVSSRSLRTACLVRVPREREVPGLAPRTSSPAGDPRQHLWLASPANVGSPARIPGPRTLGEVRDQVPQPDSHAGYPCPIGSGS